MLANIALGAVFALIYWLTGWPSMRLGLFASMLVLAFTAVSEPPADGWTLYRRNAPLWLGVFVLAATNHPWDVDNALRRPGRFDRTVLVMPPDKPAREAILRMHLRDRPVGEVDLASIAARTRGYSGADLAHVCETATELALEASVAIGEPKPIGQLDLERALQEVKPSTRSWMQTAKNYAQFANEGGIYDELLEYLRAEPE